MEHMFAFGADGTGPLWPSDATEPARHALDDEIARAPWSNQLIAPSLDHQEPNMGMLILEVSMSLDGFIAGPDPTLDEPLGRGGELLHESAFATKAFRERHGLEGGDAPHARRRAIPRGLELAHARPSAATFRRGVCYEPP
jgi:hypothetical protein